MPQPCQAARRPSGGPCLSTGFPSLATNLLKMLDLEVRYLLVIVVVAVDRVSVIISLDVLAVGGGVGREGVMKLLL